MLKFEKTCIVDRYNLIDTERTDDDRYLRQISKKELIKLSRQLLKLLIENKD